MMALGGYGPTQILAWSLAVTITTASLQARAAVRIASLHTLMPSLTFSGVRELFTFGIFNWLQGLIGLLTSQADRFLVGYLLGPKALACYAICVQAASPIHGVSVAALQIIFPYFASRTAALNAITLRRKIALAFTANVAVVTMLTLPLLLAGHAILRRWMGEAFAAYATVPLQLTAVGFALMGLNVTGHFVLMAMGRVKLLALANMVGAIAMLGAIWTLAPAHGVTGAAAGRLLFGPIICLIYLPLARTLSRTALAITSPSTLQEAS